MSFISRVFSPSERNDRLDKRRQNLNVILERLGSDHRIQGTDQIEESLDRFVEEATARLQESQVIKNAGPGDRLVIRREPIEANEYGVVKAP